MNPKRMAMPIHCPQHLVVSYASGEQCPFCEIERLQHAFKNFHRLLCERFGYGHDEVDWERDQLSLIEHIAMRFPHIERAIDDACSLTDMPANWDEDGAVAIAEETWCRAGNALRRIAGTAYRRYRYVMPAPTIGPCADGSIDLYWNGPAFTLLINIKGTPR